LPDHPAKGTTNSFPGIGTRRASPRKPREQASTSALPVVFTGCIRSNGATRSHPGRRLRVP
jgi:hypothetical protein